MPEGRADGHAPDWATGAHAPNSTNNRAEARTGDRQAESSGDQERLPEAHKTPVQRVEDWRAVREGEDDARDGRAGSGASGGKDGGQAGGQGLPGQQLRPDGVVPSGAGIEGLALPEHPPADHDSSPVEGQARQPRREEPEHRRDREAGDEQQRQQQLKERRRVQRQADALNHQARDRRQHTLATLARWGGRRAADLSRPAPGAEQKSQPGLTAKPARLLGAALDRAGAMAAKLIDKAADAIDRLFGARRDARKMVEPERPAPELSPEASLFSQWRDHGSPLADAIMGKDAPAPAPEKTARPEPERAAQANDPEADKRAEIERKKREARERWEQSLRSRDDDDPRPRGGRR